MDDQETPLVKPIKPKIAKTKSKKITGSRWTTVILLVITILACLLFYSWATLDQIKQDLLSPLDNSVSSTSTLKSEPVINQVKALTTPLAGKYGFYVQRLDRVGEYGLNQNEIFPAASLMKLPLIISLYQDSEKGKIDLESKYVLKAEDKVGGAGTLQNKAAGSSWTYREMIGFMGKYSDNTAFSYFSKLQGNSRVKQTIADIGMTKTNFKEFETTPIDIGRLFSWVYKDGLNLENRNEMFDFLVDTIYEDRIPAGLPDNLKIAHKVGTDLGVFADAGIVFSSHPFILVIMTKDALSDQATETVPQIAKLVWDFENSN